MPDRLTRELNSNTLTADYDDQRLMMAPLQNGKRYFDKMFLAACNNKLNAVKLNSEMMRSCYR
jgi:hypothetical protein